MVFHYGRIFRWLLAIPVIFVGCWAYVASPLIGSGVHLDPQPGTGILIAAVGLVVAIAGFCLIRSENSARVVAIIINVVLCFGVISLAYGLILWGFEAVCHVSTSEWGHSRPGEVLFRVGYGTLSVAVLAVFNRRVIRKEHHIPIFPAFIRRWL